MDWRLMTAVVVGAIVVAATLWLIIFPSPSFPAPSGPYSVGTRLYEMTDASRPEPFTPAADDRRHLTIRIYAAIAEMQRTLVSKRPFLHRINVLTSIGITHWAAREAMRARGVRAKSPEPSQTACLKIRRPS